MTANELAVEAHYLFCISRSQLQMIKNPGLLLGEPGLIGHFLHDRTALLFARNAMAETKANHKKSRAALRERRKKLLQ